MADNSVFYLSAKEAHESTKKNWNELAPKYFDSFMSELQNKIKEKAAKGENLIGWKVKELFYEYCFDRLQQLGYEVKTSQTDFVFRNITISW